MKHFILAACTALTLLMATVASASRFKISDIRVEGLQRVSASPVFAAMPVRVGEIVDDKGVREVIRELFKTGFFTDVQVQRDGDILIIRLKERPAIKSITIDGNKAIKTEQLTEVMDSNDLSEGEILQRHTLQGITRELERQYISRARYGAKVEATTKVLPNNMVEIDIQVDEGSSAKIRHINFVGNKVFSDEALDELFELNDGKWNSFFTGSNKYAKEKLQGDIEKLESFYLDRGYLDFKILSSQVSISPDKKSVYITLNINEGDVYKVKSIDLAGDLIVSEDRVRRLVLLREGDVFSQQRMTSTSELMTTLMGNAGYTNAEVKGNPEKNDDKTVDLTFFIDPGKRVYVRRISFSGNTTTSDEVLRREMRQIEGASASNARIESSKVRLERLGFFKGVTVETKDVPGTADLVDIEYVVEEQPSGSISASVGYSDATRINLGVNVQQNNWLGTGKQVGFGLTKNIFQTVYNFSYNDPYFTPDGVSRGFNLYYRKRDLDRLTSVSRYSTDAYGLDVSFGYPISEVARLGLSFGFNHQSVTPSAFSPAEILRTPLLDGRNSAYVLQSERNSLTATELAVTDDLLDRSGEPGFLDLYGRDFNSFILKFSWSKFTLNRGILATRGSSQKLNFEVSAPGSDLEYYKFIYDAQAFMPLNRFFTLRFKTTLGYGDGYGRMDELPFFENFFGGGFGSVRGFERSTLGPKGSTPRVYYTGSASGNYVLCEDPTEDLIEFNPDRVCTPGKLISEKAFSDSTGFRETVGGNILMEFSSELILPIPFIKDSRTMQLVAFVDAGNVFSTSCRQTQDACFEPDLNLLSSSAGLGFTWLSGFGPMTFSVAKHLNENEFDETEVFQFSFGAGF